MGTGSGTSAGVRPPDCSLGSTVVLRPADSPLVSLAAGIAPRNGTSVVSGSRPAGFSVVGFESASAGGFAVSTFGSGLSASAIGSASAARGLARSKIKQVKAKSRSKRSRGIADPPFCPRAQTRAEAELRGADSPYESGKFVHPWLKHSIPRKPGLFVRFFGWLWCRIGSRNTPPIDYRWLAQFTDARLGQFDKKEAPPGSVGARDYATFGDRNNRSRSRFNCSNVCSRFLISSSATSGSRSLRWRVSCNSSWSRNK